MNDSLVSLAEYIVNKQRSSSLAHRKSVCKSGCEEQHRRYTRHALVYIVLGSLLFLPNFSMTDRRKFYSKSYLSPHIQRGFSRSHFTQYKFTYFLMSVCQNSFCCVLVNKPYCWYMSYIRACCVSLCLSINAFISG